MTKAGSSARNKVLYMPAACVMFRGTHTHAPAYERWYPSANRCADAFEAMAARRSDEPHRGAVTHRSRTIAGICRA